MKLSVLDLFSGIGGFSLGLERTGGFKTTQFVEQDPKAQLVLKKHWPDVKIHDDIRTFQPTAHSADVVCGGFPCQDISAAGRGVGIIGKRSYLWKEMARVIGIVRPRFAIIENVSALRSRGLTLVLQDLSEIGYSAEWHCIPASSIGAPHRRDRVWIIAYRNSDNEGEPTLSEHDEAQGLSESCDVADPECQRRENGEHEKRSRCEAGVSKGDGVGVPDSECKRRENGEHDRNTDRRHEQKIGKVQGGKNAKSSRVCRDVPDSSSRRSQQEEVCWWAVEPKLGRVAHGLPGRVDRLKQLGNAVVPQLVELIGREILKKHKK